MRQSLIRSGVPEERLIIDRLGLRTLDSVKRAHDVYSLTGSFTIISQPFHVERALFLARTHGIEAIGFGSANVSLELGYMTYIREIGARVLALVDVILRS